jgi:hypothetical protein
LPTNIFIDTEFTQLSREARLISLGAVTEAGEEFYCEVATVEPAECSEFVRRIVLPLLEGGPVACPRAEFVQRFAAWLAGFADPLLLSDSDWDIYVVRDLLTGSPSRLPGSVSLPSAGGSVSATLLMLRPLTGTALATFDAAVAAHFARDPRQHHALVDARALRAGVLATRDTLDGR